MATLLLKKSYLTNSLKEVPFKDLWGSHGVFTTMRVIGKPFKIIFLKNHLNNLINSTKDYKIFKKNVKSKLNHILKINLKRGKKYNHLLRLAITNNLISISRRLDPEYKNLKYKFILKNMQNIILKSSDLALTFNNQIYETGTANLIFVKNNKLFSPKKNFYKGITLKFFDNKFNINYSNIHLKNLKDFSEIILVGSGKGVISVTNVQGMMWRRKSLKHYKILKKYYEKAVTKCPRYYS